MKVFLDYSNARYLSPVLLAVVLDEAESESAVAAHELFLDFNSPNIIYNDNSVLKKKVKWSIHPKFNVYSPIPIDIKRIVLPKEIMYWATDRECDNSIKIYSGIENDYQKKVTFSDFDLRQTQISKFTSYAFQYLFCKNIYLPSRTGIISAHMFANCNLTEITLPETVTEIGPYAFFNSQISKINGLGPNIHKLHSRAFYGTRMNEIDLSKTSIFNVDASFLDTLADGNKKIIPPYYIDYDMT